MDLNTVHFYKVLTSYNNNSNNYNFKKENEKEG